MIFPVRLWLSGSFLPPGGNSTGGGRWGWCDLLPWGGGNEGAIDQPNPVVSLFDPVAFVLITLGRNKWNPLRESFKRPLQSDRAFPRNWGVWLKRKGRKLLFYLIFKLIYKLFDYFRWNVSPKILSFPWQMHCREARINVETDNELSTRVFSPGSFSWVKLLSKDHPEAHQ